MSDSVPEVNIFVREGECSWSVPVRGIAPQREKEWEMQGATVREIGPSRFRLKRLMFSTRYGQIPFLMVMSIVPPW